MLTRPEPHASYLVLARHGATAANVGPSAQIQGRRINQSLSLLGKQQAKAAGQFLAACPLTRVVASPLRRAMETAEEIALPHGLNTETCAALTECDVGRWEGKQISQVEKEEPDAWRAFLADPATYGFPDGESFTDVYRRVSPAFEQLLDTTGAVTVAVGHNLVNRVYLAGVLGIPLRMAGRVPQHNASIDLIVRTSGETKLITLNNLSHLEPALWLPDNFPFPTYSSL